MHYDYESFTPGQQIDLGSTVVDRTEMLAFAKRFDPQPFHLDERAAAASVFGALSASGWFTCALWMRAYADAVLVDSTSLGSPGGNELRWTAPVFPGDELACSLTVSSTRVSASRPGLGLVEIIGRAAVASGDRAGQQVLQFTFTGMFGTR
ncbi:MaoC/PaaZ C-terminal domain-containing protein [Nakamurella lactea]|uniref:MaoC/PaaZ C-terminal domain-containing protein n=1 Tax=Nakamurella lactea TaxID=459515 RepID=UPI000415746A|nr:MaoC/PaaZ C-terminal domain-containing protein [Nakamurella lactea]